MKSGQEKIYYILGDDQRSITRSPHLDYFQSHGYEVLTLTDPVDSFMLMGLREYQDFPLQNVSASDLELPVPGKESSEEDEAEEVEKESPLASEELEPLIEKFKTQLGDRVADVRATDRLTTSMARLVDAAGAMDQEMQRVYRMMDKEFQNPKKVLELNPQHPIIKELGTINDSNQVVETVIDQIFDSVLLIEGIHPDPPSMIPRIQKLMELALENQEN